MSDDPARAALKKLAKWPCQKYNPPHDCGRITGDAPLPCGPCTARTALAPDRAGLDLERLAREYDDLEAELETEDVLLSDAEIETIYAAYMLVLGLEARTIAGRRDIVEPLYRAVIQARINTARQVAAEYPRLAREETEG